MTHYNYYEKMQELSFRATMALNAIGDDGLKDFYSAAENGFYQKLQTVSVEDAKKSINQSQIDQYLVFKDFVEEKEREAAEKVRQETLEAEKKDQTNTNDEQGYKDWEKQLKDNQEYDDKMQAKIEAMHN